MATYIFKNCTVEISYVTKPTSEPKILDKEQNSHSTTNRTKKSSRLVRRKAKRSSERTVNRLSDDEQSLRSQESRVKSKRPNKNHLTAKSKKSKDKQNKSPSRITDDKIPLNQSDKTIETSSGSRETIQTEGSIPRVTSSSLNASRLEDCPTPSDTSSSHVKSEVDVVSIPTSENDTSQRGAFLDNDGLPCPMIMSANPDNPVYLTQPSGRSQVRANLVPREFLLQFGPFEGCPFHCIQDNRLGAILNYNLGKEVTFIVQFEKEFNKVTRFGKHPRISLKLSVIKRLEPKWMLVDFLRSIYLFYPYRWLFVERALRRERFDISSIITSECRSASKEYIERKLAAGLIGSLHYSKILRTVK